jgi:hypothetical protein
MGEGRPSDLSVDERTELSIGLIREWWIQATQRLVEEVGSEKALRMLKPYFYNTGSAGVQNIPRILGVSEEEESQFDISIHMWPLVMGSMVNAVYFADDGSRITEFVNCATKGRSKEACVCSCQYVWQSAVDTTSPNYEITLRKSLSFEDPVCNILTNIVGKTPKVAPTSEFKVPEGMLPPLKSKDVWIYLSLSYIGEAWSNATRGLIDVVGSERALTMMHDPLLNSGGSFAVAMQERLGLEDTGVRSTSNMVGLVQDLHQRKGAIEIKGDLAQGVVTECPFSASPPEICAQYEAFFNGIVGKLDADFEFRYDRMMTKGDKTCHWTIRKKGEVAKEKLKEEPPVVDPIMRLTNKFIDGEITKEEYEEKMAIIKKHYPR